MEVTLILSEVKLPMIILSQRLANECKIIFCKDDTFFAAAVLLWCLFEVNSFGYKQELQMLPHLLELWTVKTEMSVPYYL